MNKTMIPILLAAGGLILGACGTDATGGGAGQVQCGAGMVLFNGQCVLAGNDGNITDPTDTGGVAVDSGGMPGTDAGGGGTSDGGGNPQTDGGGNQQTDGGGGGVDAGPTDPWCDCPPTKKNPGGLEHGKKCSTHDDCLYGSCVQGGHLTGYDDTVKYCTKNNACGSGGDATQCEADGKFKAGFEKTKESGNDKFSGQKCGKVVKVCAKECKSDGDCKAWNSEMPNCIKTSTKYVSMGVIGICVKNPL